MIFYFLVLLFGVLVGSIMSCCLIYANKLKEHIEREENKNLWLKALDITWRIALLIIFVLFIILPIDLLNIYFSELDLAENLVSAYMVSFVSTLLILLFIFIKLGRIKIKHDIIKTEGKLVQHKVDSQFIRIGSIVAVFVLLVGLYIKKNHADLYKNYPLLPLILIAAIFVIVIINLWLLFNKRS